MPDKFLEPFRAPSYFLLLVVMLFGINPYRKFWEFWRKSATWEPEKHRSHLNHSRTWCVLAVNSSSCWILMLHDLSQQFLLQSETGSPSRFRGTWARRVKRIIFSQWWIPCQWCNLIPTKKNNGVLSMTTISIISPVQFITFPIHLWIPTQKKT